MHSLDLLKKQVQGSESAQVAEATASAEANLTDAEKALQKARKRAGEMSDLQKVGPLSTAGSHGSLGKD